MTRASAFATPSKVLWLSFRTITRQAPPRPPSGPPTRGSSIVPASPLTPSNVPERRGSGTGLAWTGPMIQLSTSSGVPIFKQIFDQIVYMIEAGQLADGDGLPSSRMLAANLHVNRNTVARAYAQLRDCGYIESRRRNGMVVTGAESVRREAIRHEEAQRVLTAAVTQCLELGLSADEIATIAYHESIHAKNDSLRLLFVECNVARAEEFASKLSERLEMPVEPLVLGELEPDDLGGADLVITTFFHLAEVRALAREMSAGQDVPEVLAIVVAPHVQTLVRLAQIPK